jgi:GAF domain-containing protein
MSDEAVLDTLHRLSRSLTTGDLDKTLRGITAGAVEVLPDVDQASITVLHEDGSLSTVAETAAVILDVDRRQYELREGPCYQAAVESSHVISTDLSSDERFPMYARYAVDKGFAAQAGIRLFDSRQARGALNLYSTQVGAFGDLDMLSALFVSQAAMAIAYAGEVSDLKAAVTTRAMIGKAVGIVMERYELSDDRAFAFLTRVAQHRNVKLRLVAQETIAASERRGSEL